MTRHLRPRLTCSVTASVAALALAAPATPAHTIDVRAAAEAVKTTAASHGHVDRARCWRPVIRSRRARHRSMCVAWWVHTAPEPCAVLYEVRMARHPSRRLVVIQTFQPWCGWPSGSNGGYGRGRL